MGCNIWKLMLPTPKKNWKFFDVILKISSFILPLQLLKLKMDQNWFLLNELPVKKPKLNKTNLIRSMKEAFLIQYKLGVK